MFEVDFARDLIMTGVIFGTAAFVWAGWAQERPPKGVIWRIVLVVVQVAGLVVLGFGIPAAIRHWNTPTAIDPSTAAFAWYLVLFWIEVLVIIALVIFFARTKRLHLAAPTVLIVVGLHFVPLAFVFGQPVIMLAGVLITVAGIAALFAPRRVAAPSFWAGVLAGPIFVVLGAVSLIVGVGALAA